MLLMVTTPPSPIPTILSLVALEKAQTQGLGCYPRAPFSSPTLEGWPQVKHLEVALHYIMTDVIDAWELLSPLKNHSHNICLH